MIAGAVARANAGGKHAAQWVTGCDRSTNVGEAGCMGREVGKESTCSEVAVRLDSGGIPIGVIREMGKPTPLEACMMKAEQWEIWWAAAGKAGVVDEQGAGGDESRGDARSQGQRAQE